MDNIIALVLCLLLSGCATGYQRQGWTGGYSDSQLQQDTFRVAFKGNAFVSREKVEDYLLLRCAEITIEKGFDYFVIMDEDKYTQVSSYTTPTNIQSQSSTYGTGTYSANAYGNSIQGTGVYSGQTYGSATVTGGQTYHFSKPRANCVIKCFKGEKPKDLPNSYVAYELIKYLKEKAR